MSDKGILLQTTHDRGQIEGDFITICGSENLFQNVNFFTLYSGEVDPQANQDVVEQMEETTNISSNALEIPLSSNLALYNTIDPKIISVDEWLKEKPDDVINLDFENVTRADSNELLKSTDTKKDSVDMKFVVTNLAEAVYGFEFPKHGLEKNKFVPISLNVNNFIESSPVFDATERSSIMKEESHSNDNSSLLETVDVDESDKISSQPITVKYSVEQNSHVNYINEHIETVKGCSVLASNSSQIATLSDDLKEKINWDMLVRNGDLVSVKDVDMSELNLYTLQVDRNASSENVPNPIVNIIPKVLEVKLNEEKTPLSHSKENNSASSKNDNIVHNKSKPQIIVCDQINEVTNTLDNTAKPRAKLKSLLKSKVKSVINSSSGPEQEATKLHMPVLNNEKNSTQKSAPTPHMAIIAISTDKSKNITEIVINTPQGEQVFKGKTSDLMKATSDLRDKGDLSLLKSKNLFLKLPSSPTSSEQAVVHTIRNSKDNTMQLQTSDEARVDTSEPMAWRSEEEKESDTEDDHLVVVALAEIGIAADALFSVTAKTGQKMWACPVKMCSKMFPRLNSIKTHILCHYGVRPYKCDFEGCQWSFFTSGKLKRHKETHLKRKDFMCTVPNCGRRFTTVYNLSSHQKLHLRPAQMVCPVESCGASFQTKRSLELHMKTHDVLHAPYKCSFEGCGKHYYLANSLHTHARSHLHKLEELRCQWEGCGKLFDKPCRLRAHMRIHTGDKPYHCTFKGCGWAFPSSSKLKRHQHKHTNERKFQCAFEGCGKSFLRSEHLKEHTLTHIEERTFHCPIENCKQKFSAKSSLYVHLKKHKNPKKDQPEKVTYCCPIELCNRSYSMKSSLRHHMLKFHTPVLANDATRLDYITLLTTDDDEGLQFAGESVQSSNGTCNMLNAINLKPVNTIVPEDSVTHELISADLQFPNAAIPQIGQEGIIAHVLLTPQDTQVANSTQMATVNTSHLISIPSVNTVMQESLENGNRPLTFEPTSSEGSEVTNHSSNFGSARTNLTYEDICRRKKMDIGLDINLLSNIESSGLKIHSDITMNSALLGNSHDIPQHFMLQSDDLQNNQSAMYHEDNIMTISNSAGEFQVFLLEPEDCTNQEFVESTINLRDLE